MVFRKVYIVLCAALLAAGDLCAQQVRVEPRIAGLEGNREYMSLLEQDAQLQIREDSIVNAVERARQQLREDPANRQRYSQEILQLESRIFEVRNAKGRLIDKINTIEQEWVLANLNGAAQQPAEPAAESPAGAIPDSLKVRNLVFNPYFREQLPEADYAALRRAQGLELDAVDYVNRYFANYGTICELAEAYAAAQTEADAGEIYDRYNTLQGFNRVLADSLAEAWNYIADNKGYAYGYLMDKLGQDAILAREEKRLSGAARELSALRGEVASDAVADYFLRKKVLVGYETAVAGLLGLTSARDSLRGGAIGWHRLPPAPYRRGAALFPRLRQYRVLRDAQIQLPAPDPRVQGLRARDDLPYPAGHVQYQACRLHVPGGVSALLSGRRG